MYMIVRLICQAGTLHQARAQLQNLTRTLPRELEGTQQERDALVSLIEDYARASKQEKAAWRHLGRLASFLTTQHRMLLPDSALTHLVQHSAAFVQASKRVAEDQSLTSQLALIRTVKRPIEATEFRSLLAKCRANDLSQIAEVLKLCASHAYFSDEEMKPVFLHIKRVLNTCNDAVAIARAVSGHVEYTDLLKILEPTITHGLPLLQFLDRIDAWKALESAGISNALIHNSLDESVLSSDTETFAYFVNALTQHPHLKNKFIRKIKRRAKVLAKQDVDCKSLTLLVRGLSILRSEEFMFRFFGPHVLANMDSLTPAQLANIVYYIGFSKVGTSDFWRYAEKRIQATITRFSIEDLSLACSGLYTAVGISERLFQAIQKRLLPQTIPIKSAEKFIVSLSEYSNSEVYRKLKQVFIEEYASIKKGKALVYIQYFVEAGLMDQELYRILRAIKKKPTK